jgi:hypothetical protein
MRANGKGRRAMSNPFFDAINGPHGRTVIGTLDQWTAEALNRDLLSVNFPDIEGLLSEKR